MILAAAGQPPTGLGHRRLAIIDLSAAGLQPMTVEADAGGGMQRGLTLTFNGEIYNYRELRAELAAPGTSSAPPPTPRCCCTCTSATGSPCSSG